MSQSILGIADQGSLDSAEAQRVRNALQSIATDLTQAIQGINNAKAQLPAMVTGQAASALFDALSKQANQLQGTLTTIRELTKGV